MKNYIEVLKKCPLFYNIEEEQLEKMLHCLGARHEEFDKKTTVFSEGSPTGLIGIVLSGATQMVQLDYNGNRTIISQVRPSEIFAESFACAEVGSLPFSVITNEKSIIMFVESSHILHTCENNCRFHQQLIYNLMKALASKNVEYHQKIEVTSQRTTREKLLTYLMMTSKALGSNSFNIPYDRQELADYLEVDRSGLSAEISKLRNEGVLESNKKHFTLL